MEIVRYNDLWPYPWMISSTCEVLVRKIATKLALGLSAEEHIDKDWHTGLQLKLLSQL